MRSFGGLAILCAFIYTQLPSSLVQGGTLSAVNFYSSCTGIQSALPNLSYAKRVSTGPVAGTYCNGTAVNAPVPFSLTWYYYDTYPPVCPGSGGDECCHSTATSIFNFTSTTYQDTPAALTIIAAGTVISGPFAGSTATRTSVFPTPNLSCASPMGLEARSGPVTLTITKLLPLTTLICTGVITQEYCPGLGFAL